MGIQVIEGGKGKEQATPKVAKNRDAALKRKALEIVIQLPLDPAEALRVLDHAKTIVGGWLVDPTVV